jgi:protein-disulfide isomerase
MNAPDLPAILSRTQALAQDLGIDATPAFVIGTEVVAGAVDLQTLKTVVTRARKQD